MGLLRKRYFLSGDVTKLGIFWGPSEGEISLKKIKPTWKRDREGPSLSESMQLSDRAMP